MCQCQGQGDLVSLELTSIHKGDDDVSLFPSTPTKFNLCNTGPDLPCRFQDFVKFWGWDGAAVDSNSGVQGQTFTTSVDPSLLSLHI